MSAAKHTPGPWSFNGTYLSPVDDSEAIIGVLHTWDEDAPTEGAANACLIAAAPELLEALKLAQTIIGHPDDDGSKLIAAAIAKATGEQA